MPSGASNRNQVQQPTGIDRLKVLLAGMLSFVFSYSMILYLRPEKKTAA